MGRQTPHSAAPFFAPRAARRGSLTPINRELEILRRMFSLAVEAGRLLHEPHIPKLDESQKVRKGFLETSQVLDVAAHLPPYLQPVVKFAYLTGWLVLSEVLPLEWRQVDMDGGEIRLDVGSTKNGEARCFPINGDLRALLTEQRRITDAIQQEQDAVVPTVFHRNGVPIQSFYKTWHTACRKAGLPGRIPHDMRRSSARNMIRRGIAQKIAQDFMGHKTAAIFDRYHIVSMKDRQSAVELLGGLAGDCKPTPTPEVKQEVKPAMKLVAGGRNR